MSWKIEAHGIVPWALLLAVATVGSAGSPAAGQEVKNGEDPSAPAASVAARIEVTATRIPEDVEIVPASITVIQGSELEARGVRDLPSALALVGGVSIAPGGDGGPAASVPEIWGLREFDAFLLVVDGVPWGGAFNPALSSLDFYNLDRIEVLRGAAPVLYGATSFVGVIHLIHRAAGSEGRNAQLFAGSYGAFGAAYSSPLPASGSFKQSLSVDGERRGFKDDDTGYDKGHLLYRSTFETASGGKLRFDLDGTVVQQSPASPHLRTGAVLTPLTPLDANHNPRDAKIDESRLHLVGGYDSRLAGAAWSTTLALTHGTRDTVRGFLTGVGNGRPNAIGYEQDLEVDDLYFDSHLAWSLGSQVQVVAGFDHLYGRAEAEAETFAYSVNLNGSGKPASGAQPRLQGFEVEDERNFSGLYGQAEWDPSPRLHLQLGARLNRTAEDREAGEEELVGGGGEEEEEGKQSRTKNELSGVVGASFLVWGRGQDGVWLFADYRDTYKPAAIDFGPEAEAEILEPETATSFEAGIKTHCSHTDIDVTAFQMDFENLVTATTVNGLPALLNAGKTRFKGVELEGKVELPHHLLGRFSYAWHDSKFRDFVQAFDGVPTQLAGKRFEMSARELGSAGLSYTPEDGFSAYALMSYVGDRFLNKRNTAPADAYTTWAAGLGYHFGHWTVRVDGENLNDERPPVAESELGDAQYYRLPARTARLTLAKSF